MPLLTSIFLGFGTGSAIASPVSNQSVTCPSGTFVGKNGADMTTVAKGFASGAYGTNGCDGIFGLAFDGSGNAYALDEYDGNLYRFRIDEGSTE